MFSHAFQGGGLGVEIFSSSGKDPAKLWKCTRNVHRVYDRTVKGFVFLLEKGTATEMSIPPEPSKESLGLVQPVLVVQLRLSHNKHTSLEVIVLDDGGNRRRMHLSTTFREFECNDLHIQIPLLFDREDRWVNLVIDLDAIIRNCFRGLKFHSILYLCLKPVCRLRKIFTLFQADRQSRVSIPAMYEFPTGTSYANIYYPEDTAPAPMTARTQTSEHSLPLPPSKGSTRVAVVDSATEVPSVPDPTDAAPASDVEKASRALRLLKKSRGESRERVASDAVVTQHHSEPIDIGGVSGAPLDSISQLPLHARENENHSIYHSVASPDRDEIGDSHIPPEDPVTDDLDVTASTVAPSPAPTTPLPEHLSSPSHSLVAAVVPSPPGKILPSPKSPLLREVPANYSAKKVAPSPSINHVNSLSLCVPSAEIQPPINNSPSRVSNDQIIAESSAKSLFPSTPVNCVYSPDNAGSHLIVDMDNTIDHAAPSNVQVVRNQLSTAEALVLRKELERLEAAFVEEYGNDALLELNKRPVLS